MVPNANRTDLINSGFYLPMQSYDPLLQIRETSKAYPERSLKHFLPFGRPQSVKALDNVSLELSSGQVAALLGPNGAGKTTLINIICGLTQADTGTISIAGIPVPARTLDAQKKIGYVNTNDRSFFWRLTGRQNMEFFCRTARANPSDVPCTHPGYA